MSTNLTVIVGGGGVGKTTASAALALARARAGSRALVITVDPARRLADALGMHVGIEASEVEIDGVSLHARMPESNLSGAGRRAGRHARDGVCGHRKPGACQWPVR